MTAGPHRLRSLDLFRGLTVMLMLLVNMPGSGEHVYAQLDHADWNGLTFTDLVFPFFLFIVGVSVPLAVAAKRRHDASDVAILRDGARRALILFGLGVAINLIFKPTLDIDMVRWGGVLQRIGIVFFLCLLAYLYLGLRMILLLSLALLGFYAWLLLQAPITIEDTKVFAWDRALMPGRLLRKNWDPEAMMSTLPAVVNGLIGLCIGMFQHMLGRDRRLAFIGALLLIAGALLAYVIPLNKNLWTPSYVLFTCGLAILLLDTLAYVIDVRGAKRGLVLPLAFGRNAIAAYMIHTLLIALLIRKNFTGGYVNHWLFGTLENITHAPQLASLLCALIYLGLCALPILWMHKRNIIWKV
jgi:predicted acyltransferase